MLPGAGVVACERHIRGCAPKTGGEESGRKAVSDLLSAAHKCQFPCPVLLSVT